jgi:phosphatidylserine/phosphatidylglycerophosphate/cardiolipin synthase-like enzyme
MAVFAFLAWPSKCLVSTRSWFSVNDDEFLTTMAGSTGIPFFDGNAIEILNNGDEFYPAMLKAVARAQCSVTIEAYIYWAGDIGRRFAAALAERASAGVCVKILLDAVGSSTIGDEILEVLEKGGCQLAWYNPARPYSIGRSITGRTANRSSSTAVSRSPGARASRITGWDTPKTTGIGATFRFAWRGPPSCRCRPGSRRTGCNRPAKS